ncbi:MAG: T9SS type B sorting domain-containing protein [Flavobacterium sp.]|nr:MAG: T9SS type B sorting domain-containing protein [Flavobacterium sp.]
MDGFLQTSHPSFLRLNVQKVSCLLAFLFFQLTFALPDFTLTVTKTDESCLGNGTLTFAVSGTDPAASVEYKIYQLPDLINAISVQTNNFLGGRASGTYRVIATQSLNGETNSQMQEITINNVIVPLAYTLSSTHAVCGPDAAITVTPTSGNAVQFEIISGPVIRSLQSSPVFSLIPAGTYEVRVFDNCGVGWVVTHTVISDAASLTVSPIGFPDEMLPTCDSVNIANSLTASAGDALSYPLNVEYTIFPPGGGTPIVITKTVASGETASADVSAEIPLYYDQPYYVNVKVTDNCGNIFFRNDNLIDIKLKALLSAEDAKCGQKFLSVRASFYRPDITVQWLSTPPGFDPVAFNAAHPGPFSLLPINYGSYDQPVPWGFYKVKITDGCGRTAEAETTLIYQDPHPVADIQPYVGCESNKSLVKIKIPGFLIVTAILTAAPSAYPFPIPDDVSDQITENDGVVLDHLITGQYSIHLVDDCGNVYDFNFFVPDTQTSTTSLARPDCEFGKGSVRIRGSSTTLTSAVMTSAPAEFQTPVPYDVGFNLTPNGTFSMSGLPPGIYIFHVTDSCGLSHDVTVNVVGYAESQNDFSLTPHCGSFDFLLNYTSTASGGETFWLQKLNTVTNTWGHPLTGVAYIDGDIPSNLNSYPIANNTINLNLTFTGQFRIVKYYQSFNDGSAGEFKECIKPIREFEFTGEFEIIGFEKITCNGALADIRVLTNGVPPLTYKIIRKNGQPFFFDNGNNNVFTNLEQAVYTFEVQHACGHIAVGDADVAQLPSLANAVQPGNLELCDDASNDGQETFDLSSQDAVILGTQIPTDYTLTYHTSLADATLGANPLPASFTSGNTTIYARLKYNGSATECFDIVQFQLIVHPYPVPDMAQVWPMCEGNSVTITAPLGFDSYSWSTGQHTRSITVSQSGPIVLTVTDDGCSGDFAVDVVVSSVPTIQHIDTSDWTQNDNTIAIILEQGNGDYLFSIDGVHYQASNVFNNLPPGGYTVYVKDSIGDCGIATGDVFLLTYPRFFTPNGDGFNDFWKIKFSEIEPHLMTYIFDRYGKLITGFLPDSPGWDGKLNGQPLPSTDYWFLVVREDGKEFRGHFAMKR